MIMAAGMSLLSGLTACWRWLRPCAGCRMAAASRARTVRNARRDCRAPVARVLLDPVPEWEELPEASRVAAGCLVAVLMVRMIRAGRAVPGEDGHDERVGGTSAGAGREQGPGMAPGPARRRLRAPVHDGAGHRARRVDAAAVRAVRARRRSRLGAVPGPGDRRGPGPLGVRCRGPARVPAAGVGGRAGPRGHRARIEMSRLARSGREWHQLLELCAL